MLLTRVMPELCQDEVKFLCGGPSRICSVIFSSPTVCTRFVFLCRDKTLWIDPSTRAEVSLTVKNDRSRAEVALFKMNGVIWTAVVEALKVAGWSAGQFRLMCRRDKLHIEDTGTTVIYCVAQYTAASEGNQLGYSLEVDALRECGIRDLAGIQSAAKRGLTIGNAHIAGGV